MATGKGKDNRARRFTNESNGRKLVQAVADFRSKHGWPNMNARGFWEAFAGWAAAQEDLRPWAASGTAWGARYRRATFRFSTGGEQQHAEANRVLAAALAAHVSIPGLWAAIGGPRDAASGQFNAERPWDRGALGRLAERLGVTEASLRGPAAPMQEPLPMNAGRPPAARAPVPERPSEPGTAFVERLERDERARVREQEQHARQIAGTPFVRRAVSTEGDVAAAVADAEELRRLRRMFRMLDKLAKMKAHLDARDLRQIVGYGRGRDLLDMIAADRLTEARAHGLRPGGFLDDLADAVHDAEDD
jgi:hypothetical protein